MDPTLMKRAKVRGALEGLTTSEIVEHALEAYAPQIIEGANDPHIQLKFLSNPAVRTLISKHTK